MLSEVPPFLQWIPLQKLSRLDGPWDQLRWAHPASLAALRVPRTESVPVLQAVGLVLRIQPLFFALLVLVLHAR